MTSTHLSLSVVVGDWDSPTPGQTKAFGHVSRAGERGALFLDISNIPAQDTPSLSPPPQQPLDPFLPLSLFLSLTRSHPAHTRPSAYTVHSRGCSPAAWLGRRDRGPTSSASQLQAAGSPALGDPLACAFPCSGISSP